jgi:PTS system mannose-specific IIA component
MIGILVLTHGAFGEDLLSTACGIMHDEAHIAALNLSRRLDFPTLRKRVSEAIRELDSTEGVLVLIDAYGGTSYNTTRPLMAEFKISLVTGVNLPMVLSALSNRNRMTVDALAKKVSEDARKTISVMSAEEKAPNDTHA